MQASAQQRAVALASSITPLLQGEDAHVVSATLAGLLGAMVTSNAALPIQDRERILAAHALTLDRMAEILSAERAASYERMAQ